MPISPLRPIAPTRILTGGLSGFADAAAAAGPAARLDGAAGRVAPPSAEASVDFAAGAAAGAPHPTTSPSRRTARLPRRSGARMQTSVAAMNSRCQYLGVFVDAVRPPGAS